MTHSAVEPVNDGRLTQPVSPQSNVLANDVVPRDEPPAHAVSWIGIDLKRRMFSVIATSVGSRSMLDAPKKPTMPFVRSSTYCGVVRLGDRPAVAEHQDVRVDRPAPRRAAPARARRPRRASCAVCGADAALGRQAHVRDEHVGAGLGHRARLVLGEHVGRGQQVELVRARGSSRPPGRSPCRSPPGPARNVPSISPTVGKFCTPVKPARLTSSRKRGISRNGIGAADAGQHRRVARRPAAPRAPCP